MELHPKLLVQLLISEVSFALFRVTYIMLILMYICVCGAKTISMLSVTYMVMIGTFWFKFNMSVEVFVR